jgi:CarD family transcriptional regulator
VIENIAFECGDHVVYPHHGAGKVLKKELRKMFGESGSTSPSRSSTTT